MGKEILVVDDQPGIRMLLADLFKSIGYGVQTAETGQEALDFINANECDLLVLDYQLPVIDGIGVLEQLKERNIDVPAILISGLADDFIENYQCNRYIKKVFTKPFDMQDICTAVHSILS